MEKGEAYYEIKGEIMQNGYALVELKHTNLDKNGCQHQFCENLMLGDRYPGYFDNVLHSKGLVGVFVNYEYNVFPLSWFVIINVKGALRCSAGLYKIDQTGGMPPQVRKISN